MLAHFNISYDAFEARHHLIVSELEAGRLSLEDYLSQTAFSSGQKPYTRAEFYAAMLEQSTPNADTLALARALSAGGRVRMYALNNESRELNNFRIRQFGLDQFLLGFLSSCYLGLSKPNPAIYRLALELTHTDPSEAVMIDDRMQNVEAARSVGMNAVHHTDASSTRLALEALGVPFERV